jgi:hypothetical protein
LIIKILVVWIFPHGHDRWQFTPELHLKFASSSLDRVIPLPTQDINQENGFVVINF